MKHRNMSTKTTCAYVKGGYEWRKILGRGALEGYTGVSSEGIGIMSSTRKGRKKEVK